jgi:hypothetical protein
MSSGVLESLFNDLLKMDRSLEAGRPEDTWASFEGGHFFFEEMCREPPAGASSGAPKNALGGTKKGLDLELCEIAPDFYFSTPPQSKDSSCCKALAGVFEELASQGLRTNGPVIARSNGGMELSDAKQVTKDTAGCPESFHMAVAHQQGLYPDTYASMADRELFDDFLDADMCWVNLALHADPFTDQGRCCAAADVLMSRLMWLHNPSLGQAYFPKCPMSRDDVTASCAGGSTAGLDGDVLPVHPIPDEASFMAAVNILCQPDNCRALHANDDWFRTLHGNDSIQAFCEDPCRCSSRVEDVEGCGFHSAEDSTLPFCYVNNPSKCTRATASAVHEDEGFVHCPLSIDTCQMFDSTTLPTHLMCSSFVADGTSVFVHAGDTLESMSVFSGSNNSVASLLVGTVDDVLAPWALEAALVSLGCFQAHASFLCHSRFRPCAVDSDARTTGSRLARARCSESAVARTALCRLPVFNSLFDFDFDEDGIRVEVATAAGDGGVPTHCDLSLNPLLLSPHCNDTFNLLNGGRQCMDGDIFNLLNGNNMLRQTALLGQPLFADDSPESTTSFPAFDAERASAFVTCPRPFVKNHRIDATRIAPYTQALTSESALPEDVFYDNRFCVSPCPSFVFEETDYSLMYWCYVIPGVLALILNLGAFSRMAPLILRMARGWAGNRWRKLRHSPSSDVKIMPADSNRSQPYLESSESWPSKYPPDTCGLVFASVLFGCVGVLPSAVLYHDLPCGCETEVCFQTPSVWCAINRSSPFCLQMIVHCLAWKLIKLYFSLVNDFYSPQYKLVHNYGGRMVFLVPLICGVVSYATEVTDPRHPSYALHFVRSAFTCRMRFPSLVAEFLLHQCQVLCSALIVLYVVARVVRIITSTRRRITDRNDEPGLRNRIFSSARLCVAAMIEKPKVLKIVVLGILGLFMAVFCVILTVLSAPVFASFHDDTQNWHDCVKFSFARRSLFGDASWDSALAEGGGDACPDLPKNGPSTVSIALALVTESLVPMVIAFFFGTLRIAEVTSFVPSQILAMKGIFSRQLVSHSHSSGVSSAHSSIMVSPAGTSSTVASGKSQNSRRGTR